MCFRRNFILLCASLPLIAQVPRDFPAGYRWEILNIPNSAATGISNNGFLTGYYTLNDTTRGFVRNPAGVTQDVDYPGAQSTRPEAVNNGGVVVGSYNDTAGKTRGFIRASNGTYTSFEMPGALSTVLTGINESLQVSGYFVDGANESQIITFTNPASPQIITSISPQNRAYDIATDGSLVGSYPVSNTRSGFIRTPGGAVTPFSSPCPGSILNSLEPLGVNSFFDVAGTCTARVGGAFVTYSFLRLASGKILLLTTSFPGMPSDGPFGVSGINDLGELAGVAVQNNQSQALVARPCTADVTAPSSIVPAAGGVITVTATPSAGCRLNAGTPEAAWARLVRGTDNTFQITVDPNVVNTPRNTTVFIAGVNVPILQAAGSCSFVLNGGPVTFPVSGGGGTINLITACPWTASSTATWIAVSPSSGSGNGTLSFTVERNTGTGIRTGSIVIGTQEFVINQAGDPVCGINVNILGGPVAGAGGAVSLAISTAQGCPWGVSTPAPYVSIPPHIGIGSTTLPITFAPNPSPAQRVANIIVSGVPYAVTQLGAGSSSAGLRFVPVAPCRAVDTRPEGRSGAYGPPRLSAGSTRDFNLPLSGCGIPASARAYSLNITVVPQGPLGYLTVFPTGQPQGGSSTLNSWNGRVVANAAIVAAGAGGSISIFVTDATNVIVDVNGYFTESAGLAFYPVQPCRAVDTRTASGKTGQFGPPSIAGQTSRSFSIPLSGCGIPASAQAYSTNVTAVPPGYLGFVTMWPAGQTQPFVSTLNSWDGQVVPNAAIIPAGANGEIRAYVSNNTDLVIDVNGYFAPEGQPGALLYYAQNPCRIVDTRDDATLAVLLTRTFPVAGRCNVPGTARAYVFNATAVPSGYLAFATLWPGGEAQPLVSTLNSWNSQVVANMAIVPAGNGMVSTYVSNPASLILDAVGYFAP